MTRRIVDTGRGESCVAVLPQTPSLAVGSIVSRPIYRHGEQ